MKTIEATVWNSQNKTEPRMIGYVRVSSRDQNEDRQVIAMRKFGVPEDHIMIEKQSGKDFNRPIYQKMLQKLKPNDILVIKSIDRLGRNYEEIVEQWRLITKEKKAAIVVIDIPLLDTRRENDLTGTLVADLVLQLLSYVAETERRFIKQRQAEGIAAAKARGVKFGPPEKEKPENYEAILDQFLAGKITGRSAAMQLGVPRSTFQNWAKKNIKTQTRLSVPDKAVVSEFLSRHYGQMCVIMLFVRKYFDFTDAFYKMASRNLSDWSNQRVAANVCVVSTACFQSGNPKRMKTQRTNNRRQGSGGK